MSAPSRVADQGAALLALYDRALPAGVRLPPPPLRRRGLAEDLTAETFLAAVGAVQRETRRPT